MMVRISPASMYSCTDSCGMLRSRSACTARSRSFGARARARAINSSALGMAFFGGALARVSTTVMRVSPGFWICVSLRQGGRADQAALRLHLRLVGDAGEAFGAAEHGQHVKNAGR